MKITLDKIVLIVPCGMETRESGCVKHIRRVLIVPCGMETEVRLTPEPPHRVVLIVPCGMETHFGNSVPELVLLY